MEAVQQTGVAWHINQVSLSIPRNNLQIVFSKPAYIEISSLWRGIVLLLLQQLSADIDRTVYSGLNFVSRPQIISQCLFLTPSSEYTILNSQKGSKFVSFLYLDPQMSDLNVMEDGPRWCDVSSPPPGPRVSCHSPNVTLPRPRRHSLITLMRPLQGLCKGWGNLHGDILHPLT